MGDFVQILATGTEGPVPILLKRFMATLDKTHGILIIKEGSSEALSAASTGQLPMLKHWCYLLLLQCQSYFTTHSLTRNSGSLCEFNIIEM